MPCASGERDRWRAWEPAGSPRNGLRGHTRESVIRSRPRSRAGGGWRAAGCKQLGWGLQAGEPGTQAAGRQGKALCTPAGSPATQQAVLHEAGHYRRDSAQQGRSCRPMLTDLWQQQPPSTRIRVPGPNSTWEFLPSGAFPKGGSQEACREGPSAASQGPRQPGRRPPGEGRVRPGGSWGSSCHRRPRKKGRLILGRKMKPDKCLFRPKPRGPRRVWAGPGTQGLAFGDVVKSWIDSPFRLRPGPTACLSTLRAQSSVRRPPTQRAAC